MSDPKYKPAMDTASFVTNQEVTAAELNRLTGEQARFCRVPWDSMYSKRVPT